MALFKEGNPGGGRKLGSKNKIKRALEVFRQLEFNPLEEAIEEIKKLATGPKKAELLLKLSEFLYPKMKEEKIPMTPEESVASAKNLLDELKSFENINSGPSPTGLDERDPKLQTSTIPSTISTEVDKQ